MRRARPERWNQGLYWDYGPVIVRGCSAVSPGCAHCWAAGIDHRFGWGNTTAAGGWSGRVHLDYEPLQKVLKRELYTLATQERPKPIR